MMLTFEEAVSKVCALPKGSLVAVDGMPCSGKSTLAERMEAAVQGDVLPFDDFFIPKECWPSNMQPNYPFPFFRTDDFVQAVKELKVIGKTNYYPFDWDLMRKSKQAIPCTLDKTVIVEGTGVLSEQVNGLYDLRFYVESDWSSAMTSILKRDGDFFAKEWETMFIPSDDIYLATHPQNRTHFIVAGRGIAF